MMAFLKGRRLPVLLFLLATCAQSQLALLNSMVAASVAAKPVEDQLAGYDANGTLAAVGNDTECGNSTISPCSNTITGQDKLPLNCFDLANCKVVNDNSSLTDNATATEDAGRLSMESEMPVFITSPELRDTIDGPLPENKTLITILTTVTYISDVYPVGALSAEATRFALHQLNTLPNWLPNYELAFELVDDNGANDAAIEQLTLKLQGNDEAVNRFPLMTLTDSGDFAQWITAAISEQYNFVSFTLLVNIMRLYKLRRRFPNYYGLLLERPDAPYIALIELMETLGWDHVAIISEVDLWTDMMDEYLVTLLEEANFTTIYMAKFGYESEDEDEMTMNFDILKARDARIIISQALSNVNMACWLHRYGMYGPNYVIFALNWNSIDENSEIPEYLPWCTKTMVLEVLTSMMWFGDGTLEDVLGEQAVDATGIRTSVLDEYLISKVSDADPGSNSMTYWAPYFYDRALYLGLLLNRTEELLNERNETLSDWITTSPNFQENGSEIAGVIKEAMHDLNITGVKGDYAIDANDRPAGFVPIGFIRVLVSNESSSTQTVAYYKNNERRILFTVDKVEWGTFDGLPPKDKLRFISVKRPVFPTESVEYLFEAVAAFVIFVCLVILTCFGFSSRLRKNLPSHILPILIGNSVVLIHVFIIPVIERSNAVTCPTIVVIILVGSSVISGAIAEELHNACSRVPSRNAMLGYKSASYVGPLSVYHKYQTFVVSKRGLFALAWPLLQLVLLVLAIVTSSSLPIQTTVTQLKHVMSPVDPSLAYKPYRYECSVAISVLERSTASCAFLGIVACLQVYLLIRKAYFSYFLYSNRKRVNIPVYLNRASKYLYCKILVIIGGLFVGTMDMSNNQYLLVTTSSVVIVLVIINLCLIVFPQLKLSSAEVVDSETDQQEHVVSVHPFGAPMTLIDAHANQARIGQQTEMRNVKPRRRSSGNSAGRPSIAVKKRPSIPLDAIKSVNDA